MHHFIRHYAPQALLALGCIAACAQTFAATPASDILGTWKVTRGVVAPGVKPGRSLPDTRTWLGQTVRFASGRVTGPAPMGCGNARYEATHTPPEGLFQGVLPAPAKDAAWALDLPPGAVPGTSLTCDTGIFELHRAGATTLLVAVDNVIWTLDRSPGR